MVSLLVSVYSPISTRCFGNICCRGAGFGLRFLQHSISCSLQRRRIGSLHRDECSPQGFPFSEGYLNDLILARKGSRGSMFVVRANQGFDFNGGGGGGGWDKSTTSRVLGNLGLAIGFTYLTVTGQLGWILDAIVSIWLLAVLLPIVGLGAFFWFAGRDIVQSSCPNCGNEFQIFKSSVKDGPQLCPFCSQPFSVKGNTFVREAAQFSSGRSTTFGQAFSGFSPRAEKGKASSSTTVVDVEAEVKDID